MPKIKKGKRYIIQFKKQSTHEEFLKLMHELRAFANGKRTFLVLNEDFKIFEFDEKDTLSWIEK